MKSPTYYSTSHCRHAFTLVEMLVVFVIIISLAAISLSVTRNLRAKADETLCLSKLSQLGQAAIGASNESNGYLAATYFDPDNGGAGKKYWWETIAPLIYTGYDQPPNNKKLDGLFRDPTSPTVKTKGIKDSEFRNPSWSEIGWMPWQNSKNVPSALNSAKPGIHLNILDRPSGQPFLSSADNTGSMGVYNKAQFDRYVVPAAKRHRGQILVFYCDGHVEMVKVAGDSSDYMKIAPAMPDAK